MGLKALKTKVCNLIVSIYCGFRFALNRYFGIGSVVVYKDWKWCRNHAYSFETGIIRKGRRKVTSNTIQCSRSYAFLTQSKDRFIENLVKSHKYTFDRMLVIIDPYYQSPLTALAVFYTENECSVRYTVKGKTQRADYSKTLDACTEHRVPVFGLYADYDNTVILEILDSDNKVLETKTLKIKTGPLPNNLKDAVSVAKHTKKSAIDMVMISGGLFILTCAFDEEGEIRWYLRRQTKAYGIFPLAGGRFLYMEKWVDIPCFSVSQSCMMHEMDYLGRIYKTYYYKNGFHHCAREITPYGNILLGSNSLSDGYDENMIIELDRITGAVIDRLNLNDLFDNKWKDRTDWIHINSVCYCKEDDSVIVSVRNVHSVFKVDWKTKKIKWIFSHRDMWKNTNIEDKLLTPSGDVKWTFQQHAAYKLEPFYEGQPDNIIQIIIYDNHWAKRRPVDFYDGDKANSYLSIFTIDEKAMTVKQEDITQVPNSRIRSNALLYENENRIFNMAGDLVPVISDNSGMVEEYDFTTKELLNRYFVKPGFFTAYPFEPDINQAAEPVAENDNYWLGNTIEIMSCNKEIDIATAKRMEHMAQMNEYEAVHGFSISEDMLFMKAVDHSVPYLYFVSDNRTYYADLTMTYQTTEKFADKVYEVPFWLKNMAAGTYNIYYEHKCVLYNACASFTIE